MNVVKRTIQRGRRVFSVLSDHRYTTIAGTLTFFLVLSFVPFVFWLTLLFGEALDIEVLLSLELFGWAKDLIVFLQSNAEGAHSGAGVFLLATTLWSGSAFFYHLRRSGEIVYGCRRSKQGWKVRASALVFTLLLMLFLGCTGVMLGGAVWCSRFLPSWLYYPVVYSLVLSLGFFVAWLLNAYVCPYRTRPSDTVTGSYLTAIAWMIASIAFHIYLNLGNKEQLYGALSTVIVFLLWLYWMMICLTAGIILNKYRLPSSDLQQKKY